MRQMRRPARITEKSEKGQAHHARGKANRPGISLFYKIAHNRTADSVRAQIEGLILEGILRPGDRLPAERELAKKVGVSRPILREAIKALEDKGLILSRQGEGTFVANVIGTVFTEPIVGLIRDHPKASFDYIEFRREIEGSTAAFAAERATEADRTILTRIFRAMEEAHGRETPDEEAAIDVEFHNAIGECAHNAVLLHVLRSCYRLLSEGVFFNRMRLYGRSEARDCLLVQHRRIYDAMMAGDAAAARLAAQEHMEYVSQELRRDEQVGAWEEISEMRLQKMETEQARPARRRPAASPGGTRKQ